MTREVKWLLMTVGNLAATGDGSKPFVLQKGRDHVASAHPPGRRRGRQPVRLWPGRLSGPHDQRGRQDRAGGRRRGRLPARQDGGCYRLTAYRSGDNVNISPACLRRRRSRRSRATPTSQIEAFISEFSLIE